MSILAGTSAFLLLGGPLPPAAETQGGPQVAGTRAGVGGERPTERPAAAGDSPGAAVPGELLVRFRAGVDAGERSSLRERVGADLEERLPLQGLERLDLDPGVSIRQADAGFERDRRVVYAEPNYYRRVTAAPADAFFTRLWGLDNTGQVVNGRSGSLDADIDAPEAWNLATGSAGVTVAVIDTGVAYDHADLSTNVWLNPGESGAGRDRNRIDDDRNGEVDDVRGWDFVGEPQPDGGARLEDNDPRDPEGHGTHVAGTVGAQGNNGTGVTGVNWDVSLMPIRVLDEAGSGTLADVLDGYAYAARNGARIVNASIGGSGRSQSEADFIAANPSVLFAVAAGNDATDNEAAPQFPCNYPAANVVCVAASTQDDGLATFSSYGRLSVDLAAPGENVLSTQPTSVFVSGYAYYNGTSMATPHVAGAAALIKARYPSASVVEIKNRLLAGVDKKDAFRCKTFAGGRLNVDRALSAASPPVLSPPDCSAGSSAGSDVLPTAPPPPPAPAPAPAPDPSETPSGETPPPPAADHDPPAVSLAIGARQRLATVLKRGLVPSVGCSETCRIKGTVTMAPRTARRLGVRTSGGGVIGRGFAGLAEAGRTRVTLKLTRQARSRLRSVRYAALTVRAEAADPAANTGTARRRIAVRR